MKVVCVVIASLVVVACAPQGRFERAGQDVDESIDDVREGVRDVVEDVRETAEDVGDNAERRRRR
jgi:hypothetical protein